MKFQKKVVFFRLWTLVVLYFSFLYCWLSLWYFIIGLFLEKKHIFSLIYQKLFALLQCRNNLWRWQRCPDNVPVFLCPYSNLLYYMALPYHEPVARYSTFWLFLQRDIGDAIFFAIKQNAETTKWVNQPFPPVLKELRVSTAKQRFLSWSNFTPK